MKTILHEMAHSPFCIPIVRILEGYGVDFERVQVSAWDRRELARLTGGAYYQVPVLEHGSSIVYETAGDPLALPHYLDETFAAGELFPAQHAGIQDIVINHIEDHLEGLGFPLSDPACVDAIEDIGERTMVIRHKERKMGPGCVERWRSNAASIAAEFESALLPYEVRLGTNDFLFGDAPVYADYALYGVLGNAQHSGDFNLSFSLTNIKEWEKRMTAFSRS
ncbi:MAG: glutathione S-transferase family protein [Verrucomicrobiales bacterium]|nr:glutathione S-transferase family protein [Verrucomicrobiales bacterium]